MDVFPSPRIPFPEMTLAGTAASSSALLRQAISEDDVADVPASGPFDIHTFYRRILVNDEVPMPIAAVLALTELIASSNAGTMYELVEALKTAAATLKKRTPNPISLTAGCDLFIRFVTTARLQSYNFEEQKAELVAQGREYCSKIARECREKIANHAFGFIKDEAVVLTHSYSRVVIKALLMAGKQKRISVYVTEARPRGLGMKTHEVLTAAGIPCTVVLDSAVAYVMDEVDLVLVGSEAVVESGGLINAVGSYQAAIIAKAANKPFYALAESYKFLRLFPLSQYDLPTHNPHILSFPSHVPETHPSNFIPSSPRPAAPTRTYSTAGLFVSPSMNPEQIIKNPEVDYTRPDLITLVFSDVGILTPEGVSQFLVGIFAD